MGRTFPLLSLLVAGLAATSLSPTQASALPKTKALSFDVSEGLNLNSFLRQGPVAAHLLLRSGRSPRILVAFPAGNSGVGLWFDKTSPAAVWTLTGAPRPVTRRDAQGRPLYGIVADASINTPELAPHQTVLSSVRVLRDYQALGTAPKEVLTPPQIDGDTIIWQRDRLDGHAGYRLQLRVTRGHIDHGVIRAALDGGISLQITALSGETPLTPLRGAELLNSHARADVRARNALSFLSYKEKFLAGSWRFNTYFGRDTLMSLRLLMPALQPDAVDDGLKAVFARLSDQGEVAHEEDIGEFAILDHQKLDGTLSDAPTFNYHMIDANFMLAPVARAWLLDDPRGMTQAKSFLAQSDQRYGEAPSKVGEDLVRNLKFVLAQAKPFAERPEFSNLIHLQPGMQAGQWRDSNDGLGGGYYPYDVNAVFVPAALDAAARFVANGLLDPYLTKEDRALFARAADMAAVWKAKAPKLFEASVARHDAVQAIMPYAAQLGVPAGPAIAALPDNLAFHALSLDSAGAPVKVINSDEGFELLFGEPSPTDLDRDVSAVMRPFPAGLMTNIGMLVANPVLAGADLQRRLSKNAYHGEVIWSWQQAVMAAGLDRQLERTDLPLSSRRRLIQARSALWTAIDAAKSMQNSELWSWDYKNGRYAVSAFGANGADADESNAAQLWSTVFLALHDPTR